MIGKRTVIALFATGAAVAMLVALMPGVSAQAASFGTQVKFGDNDFIPTIRTSGAAVAGWASGAVAGVHPSSQLNITRVDYGTAGDVTDDCYYLRIDNTTATELIATAQPVVRTYDIRLVIGSGCSGKTVGSLVMDTDNAEKGQSNVATHLGGTCPAATAAACSSGTLSAHRSPRVVYADVNNNNRYDLNDCVYITAGPRSHLAPAAGQVATLNITANDRFTIRLTACSGKAAGTLLFSGDPDQTSYGAAGGVRLLTNAAGTLAAGIGFFDADNSGAFSPGDRFYVNTTTAAAASGTSQLVPLYSIRIVGDTGQFGSQVKLGDADFKPTIAATNTRWAKITRVDFGTAGDVTDDCYYLHANIGGAVAGGAVPAVATYSVRVVAGSGCSGKTVGTLVADSDSSEKGQANTTGGVPAVGIRNVYADVNNNNRYDSGDCVYLTEGAGTAGALNASSANAYSIRLTPCSGKAAGTLVYAGDPDFVSYGGSGIKTTGTSGAASDWAHLGFFDADTSGTFTPGDRLYMLFNTTATALPGGLVPLYSVRIVGDTGQFGSQVKFGDSDFIPTIGFASGTAAVARKVVVHRVDFGTAGDVTDDCYYMRTDTPGAPAGTLPTYAVRLAVGSGCSGKTIGSLVADTDNAEKGQANTTGGVPAIGVRNVYADVNNNNRYDASDCIFLTEGAGTAGALNASSANAYSIRLTPCSGKAAGTLVYAGDPDFVSYGGSGVKTTGTAAAASDWAHFGIFDGDRSGTFTPGDRLYMLFNTTATALPANLVPQFAVRMVGDFTTGGGGGTTAATGVTTTTTGTAGTTGTGATTGTGGTTATTGTRTTTGTGGTGGTTGSPTKTPGLELVAIVAGIASVAAIIAVGRRKA